MAKQNVGGKQEQPREIPADESGVAQISNEEIIAVAAYYLAERRGFSSGQELDDWLQAEKEIESRAAGGSGV